MADKSNKEIVADVATKVIIAGIGIVVIKNIFNSFTNPGLTTRLKFDYPATQVRKFYTGDGVFHEVADPWTPNDLAHRLHSSMDGLEMSDYLFGISPRKEPWEEISRLGIDRARWLHNYWLDSIDADDTLYRWIDEEWANYEEYAAKDAALSMLTRAGAGW